MNFKDVVDRYFWAKLVIAVLASVVLVGSELGLLSKFIVFLFVWLFFLSLTFGKLRNKNALNIELSDEEEKTAVALLRQGKKMDAIKMVRAINPNVSFDLASRFIESIGLKIEPQTRGKP